MNPPIETDLQPSVHVLREYALLADGERGAVVGPSGEIAWLCAPGWADGSVCNALVGGRGLYVIRPHDRYVWGGSYESGSLVWRTRWVTTDGVIECYQALAFPGAADRVVLLHRVEVTDGDAQLDLLLRPRADHDEAPFTDVRRLDGHPHVWTGRTGDLQVRWTGPERAVGGPSEHRGEQIEASAALHAGDRLDLVLELGPHLPDHLPDPDRLWRDTRDAWRAAVPDLTVNGAPRDALHAWAVMRGLTSNRGDGMVAAATTSLPEHAEAGRNYDYRYAWIRDQCYAGCAASAAGAPELLDAAVRFVSARVLEDGPELSPAYTVTGGRVPDQRTLALPGYPGADVRIGNHVNEQFQLDALGEVLRLLSTADRAGRLDDDARRAVKIAIDAVDARWDQPDAGIWELDANWWTHSRLAAIAGLRGWHADALADRILEATARRGTHRSGRWQRGADDARVDAALLLGSIHGATPPSDPRNIATLEAVAAELTEDGYVYRFRPDERPLGEAEGAFTLCGFWISQAWHALDEEVTASRWFERTRASCGPPGLLTEEVDVAERQLRGNFPQAFVHAALLECAATLPLDDTA
ncbi:MAG: glycoside hydrolase family 15 protein [Pseudonocardia sp.]|nr:glycoside hydrolase family 15 protein [Pseudonocardia sp.]